MLRTGDVPVKLRDAGGAHHGQDAVGDAGRRVLSHLGRQIAVDTRVMSLRCGGRVTAAADDDTDADDEQGETAVTLDGP